MGKLQEAESQRARAWRRARSGMCIACCIAFSVHAVKWGVVATNPVAGAEPPRVERTEVEILAPDQIKAVLAALRGKPLYASRWSVLPQACGAERLPPLRLGDVDFDQGKIRVERSLEQTKVGLTSSRRRQRPAAARFRFHPLLS